MTDTDYTFDADDLDLDDLFGGSEGEADLSLMFPPNGWYNAVIKFVRHDHKFNQDKGKISRGWYVNVQLDCPEGPQKDFHGQFASTYIWFGYDKNWTPSGLQQLGQLLSGVTGETFKDNVVNLKDYGPVKRTDRNGKPVVIMSYFDDLPCRVHLTQKTEVKDGTETTRVMITGWGQPVPYDPDAIDETGL